MQKIKSSFHGSDVELIEEIYNINKNDIINFSSNVNPLGMPLSVKQKLIENISLLEDYPNRENSILKKSLAEYCNCNTNDITIGNGASEVTRTFIKAISPKNTLIIAPTYSEYENDVKEVNSNFSYFELEEKDNFIINIDKLKNELRNNFDLLIICNPNNPTSTLIPQETLKEIVSFCKELNTFVIVDETYIEFVDGFKSGNVDGIKIISESNLDNLIIIRGVSKFFSLAGLRFGYSVCCNVKLNDVVSKQMNVWSVNSMVEPAVCTLVSDEKYINETNKFMSLEKTKILARLNKIEKLKVYEPKANFILIKILNDLTSDEIFEMMIRENLMIRNCESFNFLNDKFFRFCVLESWQNEKLLLALEDIFK